ncbi:nucleoplasmin-2 [Phaenicophaeus curvirostris]|uniref:nucleoplasmin-2 n=1 Tax=Phaenicophaeus curvirostris TaxID=33595 RepID=UPI0037F0AC1B
MFLMNSTGLGSKFEKPVSTICGCELSSEHDSYTFQMLEEGNYEQQLLVLRTICLGETAQDEFHVVEILPTEENDAHAPLPIATLKPSMLPTVTLLGMEFTLPVTFHLRAGSGPVYISGQLISMIPDLSWNEEEEEEEEEEDTEDEESVEESLEKSPKDQAAKKSNSAKGRGAGRGRRGTAKK